MPAEFVELRLAADSGFGTFVDLGPAAAPGVDAPPSAQPWTFHDLDGDGDLDLPVTDGWMENTGNLFLPFAPLFDGTPIAFGDLAGDGLADVVATRSFGQTVVLLQDQGGLVFSEQVLVTGAAGAARVLFADLDDDGDVDLAVGDRMGNRVHVFENAGGTLSLAAILLGDAGPGTAAMGLAAEDHDGDGLTDLVVLRGTDDLVLVPTSVVGVHRRVGPGLAYAPPREWIAGSARFLADLDGDGDLDAVGEHLVESLSVVPFEGGARRQYGSATPGSLGIEPVLGTTGPLVGTSEVRLRRAFGSSACVLAFSTSEAALAGFPFPGITTLVDPATLVGHLPFPVLGPAEPGKGSFDVPVQIGPGLAGLTFYQQIFAIDPGAATIVSATNGLEITYAP